MKKCWKCQTYKIFDDFYKCQSRPDGLQPLCKPCQKQSILNSRNQNPSSRLLVLKKYRTQNLEKCRAASRLSKQNNKELAKRWVENNKDKVREYKANNRHKRRGAEGKFTAKEVADLLLSQKSLCAACKTDISQRFHRDHIIPIAKGGTNFISNIQLLCPSCNNKKFTSDNLIFMQRMGYSL